MPALAASNQRIRRLRRLSGRRSARGDERAFVLEGPAPIAEALRSARGVEGLYVDEAAEGFEQLVELATRHGVAVHPVAAGVLGDVTDTVTPRPVVAVVAIPGATLEDVLMRARSEQRPVLVLSEVRDPGNVGTLIRAADASGAVGVVCTTGTADPWAPKVVRASAGSVLNLPVVTDVTASEVAETAAVHGIPIMVTVAGAGVPYDDAPLDGAAAIVLGNEAHGVAPRLRTGADVTLTIPMDGAAESLNVAVAGSILMFDALRQRRRGGRETGSDWTPTPPDDKVNTS